MLYSSFFFNDTATTEIYTLSLHDALPIFGTRAESADQRSHMPSHSLARRSSWPRSASSKSVPYRRHRDRVGGFCMVRRSEEHTSELQSRRDLVCRLLLEKKKKKKE